MDEPMHFGDETSIDVEVFNRAETYTKVGLRMLSVEQRPTGRTLQGARLIHVHRSFVLTRGGLRAPAGLGQRRPAAVAAHGRAPRPTQLKQLQNVPSRMPVVVIKGCAPKVRGSKSKQERASKNEH